MDFPRIRTVGFTLADYNTGPFHLEIDYIKLVMFMYQPKHFKYHHKPKDFWFYTVRQTIFSFPLWSLLIIINSFRCKEGENIIVTTVMFWSRPFNVYFNSHTIEVPQDIKTSDRFVCHVLNNLQKSKHCSRKVLLCSLLKLHGCHSVLLEKEIWLVIKQCSEAVI